MVPKAGIYKRLPRTRYDEFEAIRQSLLKKAARSLLHYKAELDHPEPSKPHFDIGDAAHACALEPHRFDAEFVRGPTNEEGKHLARTSNVNKGIWKELEDDNPGKVILRCDDYDDAMTWADRVYKDPVAHPFLAGRGENEMGFVWADPVTGLLCKGLADRYTVVDGIPYLVDLKTARNAEPWSFRWDVAKFGYHTQAAFYLDGLQIAVPTDLERRFMLIVVEKAPPYPVVVYELAPSVIEAGRATYQALLMQVRQAMETNEWPGYATGVETLHLHEKDYARAERLMEETDERF